MTLPKCPRCMGDFQEDYDGLFCLQCGHRPTESLIQKKGIGRHRTGRWKNCTICHRLIYVKRLRNGKKPAGKYCRACWVKYKLPNVKREVV